MVVAILAPMCCRTRKSPRHRARFERARRDRRFSITDWKAFRPKAVLYWAASLSSLPRDHPYRRNRPAVPSGQRLRGLIATSRNTRLHERVHDRREIMTAKSTWSRPCQRRRPLPLRRLRAWRHRAPEPCDLDCRCVCTCTRASTCLPRRARTSWRDRWVLPPPRLRDPPRVLRERLQFRFSFVDISYVHALLSMPRSLECTRLL